MPTRSIRLIARSSAAALEISSCARICSTIWAPTRCTGLSEEIGSWKIIAIRLPRTDSSSCSVAPIRSSSPNHTAPPKRELGERVSPIKVITVTDFPEPDSPTIATTSPRSRVNVTPSTARTRPSSVANETSRSSTSSNRSAIRRRHLLGDSAREPDPGIEHRVHDVGQRTEQHHEERREQRPHKDRRPVEVADRRGLVLAHAGQVEHGLGDERGAAEQCREIEPEHRDDRKQRVAQHVLDEDLPRG